VTGADRFGRYREGDPVHRHAASDAWLITRHRDVTDLLADPRLVSATLGDRVATLAGTTPAGRAELAAFYGCWLSLTDGPVHRQLRRALVPVLAPSKVAPWAPVLHALAADQARSVRPDRFADTFARPYAARVLAAVLGLTAAEFAVLLPATGRLLRLVGAATPTAGHVREAVDALGVVGGIGDRLADRAPPTDGPVPLLHGGALRPELVAPVLVQVIGGGYDPLARCLASWARDSSAHAPAGPVPVDEVLRLHPPFELLPRLVADTVRVGGRDLAPGSRVLLAIGSANRDLDAAGRPPAHVSFGAGRHRCPAAGLARTALAAGTAAIGR
jgi:cytochrome P450